MLSAFLIYHRRCLDIKELQVNEEIRDREVRLIGEDGEQLGIVSSKEARKIAEERKLDLVKISPNAKPPVCKVMDYGKYKYELAKKEKEARKRQKTITVKEIRLTPKIEDNDLRTKAKRANGFLEDGDKVKVSVRFRGRELVNPDSGRDVLNKFAELTSENGVIDKKPKLEGRNMVMFLVSKN